MKELIDKVIEFNRKFNVKMDKSSTDVLRYKLMIEENDEYFHAAIHNNTTEIADALGDQLYILIGTIIRHGMQDKIVEIFNEIHRSNMSKLGEDGNPVIREDGKILKGPNYFKPDIKKILNE